MLPVQVKQLNGIVDWVYDGFVDIVATQRKLPHAEVLKVSFPSQVMSHTLPQCQKFGSYKASSFDFASQLQMPQS